MGNWRKGATASVMAATLLVSGGFQKKDNDIINTCDSNSGYIISTQEMRSNSVAGTYDIEKMHALSLNDKNIIMQGLIDRGEVGEASTQLNAYLKGVARDGKARYYWIQDTLHFIYSNSRQQQYLSSEVFKEARDARGTLPFSDVKGNGRTYAASDNYSGSVTYIYDTRTTGASIPQAGYLEMDEAIKSGRIVVNIRYQNKSLEKAEIYDTVRIGRAGEFRDAYFFSNRMFDIEMGFGGDTDGASGYFSNTNLYVGMYYMKDGSYVRMKYGSTGRLSTSEEAIDLSCRYYARGGVRFYTYDD